MARLHQLLVHVAVHVLRYGVGAVEKAVQHELAAVVAVGQRAGHCVLWQCAVAAPVEAAGQVVVPYAVEGVKRALQGSIWQVVLEVEEHEMTNEGHGSQRGQAVDSNGGVSATDEQ